MSQTRIKPRQDTATNWMSNNPIMASGEHGYETDNLISGTREESVKFKIGDGINHWNDLPYELAGTTLLSSLADISARAATTANLTATYANGTAGVGRTLTATTNVVLPAQDTISLVVGQELLVWKQTDKTQNGVYTVTSLGVAGVSPWILTGEVSGDTQAEIDEQVVFVIAGDQHKNKYFTQITVLPVVGTDNIVYKKGLGKGGIAIPDNLVAVGTGDSIEGTESFQWNDNSRILTVSGEDGDILIADALIDRYQLGDIESVQGGSLIDIDGGNRRTRMGQIQTGTYFITSDLAVPNITQVYNTGYLIIDGQVGNPGIGGGIVVSLGNIGSELNATVFTVDDINQKFLFSKPNFQIAGDDYVWPSAFGAAGSVLTDAAGDGILSWGAAGALGIGIDDVLAVGQALTVDRTIDCNNTNFTIAGFTNLIWESFGGDEVLRANTTDIYLGGVTNGVYAHANENMFQVTDQAMDPYFYIEPGSRLTYIKANQSTIVGKRFQIDGLTGLYQMGDINNVNNGTLITIDDKTDQSITLAANLLIAADAETMNLGVVNALVVNLGTGAANTNINIGTSGTNDIVIGNSNSTVSFVGTVLNENVTNLNVSDKLITLNDGGAGSSGTGVGFEIEEGGSITGYFKTTGGRDGFLLRAPANAADSSFLLTATSARSYTFPNVSGTVITTGDTGSIATAMIAADAVTYAKIQNVSATDRLLGRVSASAGDIEEIPITDFVQTILDDTDAATVRATLGLGIGTDVLGLNPESFIYYFSDFTFLANNSTDTWISNSSTGAGANIQSLAAAGNHCGIAALRTGTTTTGSTAYMSAADAIEPAQGILTFESVIRLPLVSDGTETYSVRIGFIDNVLVESTDGAFFRYTHSVNSGKFEIVTRKAGVETAADSGITMTANQWYKLKVVINAAATSVAFSIDGVATSNSPITSNIPNTSSNPFGFGIMILKSAGTSQRQIQTDYYKFSHALTTPR